MQSLFAGLRLLGIGVAPAYAAQAALSGAVLLALAVLIRRTEDAVIQGALMAAAALLVTPFLLDYDLTLLAIPLAVLASGALRTQFLPYEKMILLAAFILPMVARTLGHYAHLPVARRSSCCCFLHWDGVSPHRPNLWRRWHEGRGAPARFERRRPERRDLSRAVVMDLRPPRAFRAQCRRRRSLFRSGGA